MLTQVRGKVGMSDAGPVLTGRFEDALTDADTRVVCYDSKLDALNVPALQFTLTRDWRGSMHDDRPDDPVSTRRSPEQVRALQDEDSFLDGVLNALSRYNQGPPPSASSRPPAPQPYHGRSDLSPDPEDVFLDATLRALRRFNAKRERYPTPP